MSKYFYKLSESVVVLLIITILLLIVISITSFQIFKDNTTKTNYIATQSIKENANILIKQLDETLENKIEIIFSILTLISKSPVIQSDSIVTMTLLESAQNSTKDLTAYYGWSDSDGKIKLATGFENRQIYEKFIGNNVSFKKQFESIKKTLLPSFTPIIQSIMNVPTLFIVHPILGTKNEENYSKFILDNFPEYKIDNIFNSLQTLEKLEKTKSHKQFKGTIYAGINVSSMVNLLENQIPQNQSYISLLAENGDIIYSSYKGLAAVLFNEQETNEILKTQFDKENQFLLNQVKEKITSGKDGSLDISNINASKSTISYTPIVINDENVFYLVLDTPHIFAREVDNLILQQQNFAIGFIVLTSIIAILVIILLNLVNNKLKKTVSERTDELKIAVKKLEESNKVQKEFINVAAHELRTPTQSIAGYCEMIELFPENLNKYLEPIKRNVERLSILINNILDVTRIESKNFRVEKSYFDINTKINDVINEIKSNYNFEKTKSIEIIFDSSTLKPNMIFADKIKIYQVLNNLLTNAIKFTDEGKITITTENKLINNKEHLVIKIKDTGRGIDQEISHKIFDKFITKSDTGTGLGLFITKKIIDLHGGTLTGYNNNDERGATFEFSLPLDNKYNY